MSELQVNKEASHYVKLFGGSKIGNLIFRLPLIVLHYFEKYFLIGKIQPEVL